MTTISDKISCEFEGRGETYMGWFKEKKGENIAIKL